MEEFDEEDIWGSTIDPDQKKKVAGSIKFLGFHIDKFLGFHQSGRIDNSERMDEFDEEDIWGSTIDPRTKQVIGFQENECNGVAQCRSMGKDGSSNNRRKSVKFHQKESCHEENNNRRRTRYQSSAPLTIPYLSQMVWEEKISENFGRRSHGISDDDKDFEQLPPHEFIAMQLAQRGITSFSVYEGVGRTLKGRDLSRVRNAVWTRTGFIE